MASEKDKLSFLRKLVDDFRFGMSVGLLGTSRDSKCAEDQAQSCYFLIYYAFFALSEMVLQARHHYDSYSTDEYEQILLWEAQMKSEAKRIFKDNYQNWLSHVDPVVAAMVRADS